MRPRMRALVLTAIGIALATIAAWRLWQIHKNRARKAAYQSILQPYSTSLKQGATRRTVEQYIQSRGTTFERVCCTRGRAFEDLVRIGKEDHPWYCGENNVYLEFQFDSAESMPSDDDQLRAVSELRKFENCL